LNAGPGGLFPNLHRFAPSGPPPENGGSIPVPAKILQSPP
jgi:hypothetical protein